MPRRTMLLLSLFAAGLAAQQDDGPVAGMTRFVDRALTFHIDLPEGWRQLAPAETNAVRTAVPQLPAYVARNEPGMFYAVGPVDHWLQGRFDSAWLYVVMQDNEWLLDGDFAGQLAAMWREKGEQEGIRHDLTRIEQTRVGRDQHPAVTCLHTATAAAQPPLQSLDVYVPTGGRQVTLQFTCAATDFPRWEPEFHRMLATLRMSRPARGETKLSDRLWSPIVTGAIVGIVLVILYRHTRRRV